MLIYVAPKQYNGVFYQELLFSYAYFIYYNLFIAGTGIKS
jgi:hypothetical protein